MEKEVNGLVADMDEYYKSLDGCEEQAARLIEKLKEANSLADELASKSNVQSTNLAIDAKAVARAVSAEASSEASETKTINLGDLQNLLMERPLGEQVDILIEMIEATEVPLALARMVNAYFNH